ncbi:MAG: hypothetical protein C4346_17135 [Chloroflexota bacterium]
MKSVAIVGAIGRGRTQRSSVDAALRGCGIGNAVLVPVLSATIPPGTAMQIWEALPPAVIERWSRLPVLAAIRTIAGGEGAGGSRLIVAHDAAAEDPVLAELDVLSQIYASLRDMVEGRGELFDGLRVETHVVTGTVEAEPVTAVMLAILDVTGASAAGHPGDLVARQAIEHHVSEPIG